MKSAPAWRAASTARPRWVTTATLSATPASPPTPRDQAHPLLDREHAGLLEVVHDGHHDVPEQLGRLLDDVEVAEVDGSKLPG